MSMLAASLCKIASTYRHPSCMFTVLLISSGITKKQTIIIYMLRVSLRQA